MSRRSGQTLWIGAAVLVSLLIHAIAFGLFVAAGHRAVPLPTKDAEVELLMVEQKGTKAASPAPQPTQRPQAAQRSQAKAPPAKPAPVKPAQAAKPPPEAPKPQVETSEAPLPPPAPKPPTADKPRPAPAEAPPRDAQPPQAAQADKPTPPVQPTPPSNAEKALKFDLDGTGADSDAEVTGGHVLPASPDDRYRNMPPPYPSVAAEIGAKGTVSVIIHVGADGLVAGVDIVRSSGFYSLDAAVTSTVRKWRFHPALRNAQAVPFDLPFDFIYRDD